jgi:hypothetical protein
MGSDNQLPAESRDIILTVDEIYTNGDFTLRAFSR